MKIISGIVSKPVLYKREIQEKLASKDLEFLKILLFIQTIFSQSSIFTSTLHVLLHNQCTDCNEIVLTSIL